MSAVAAPFGFRLATHPAGQSRARPYTITTGYGANLFRGSPVQLDSTNKGTIIAATTSSSLIGIFAGCEFIDAFGKPQVSAFWPSGQAATNIIAWVYDDPTNVFEVQTDGTGTTSAAVEQTYVGGQFNCVNPTVGSTYSGQSTAALDGSSLVTSGSNKQFRCIGFAGTGPLSMAGNVGALSDALGDQFLTLQVQISLHQYVAGINAV